MKRREFITLIGGAATWPLAARAQQPAGRVYRVGYLAGGSQQTQLYLIKAFEEGLRSLGYRVGQNIVIEYRFADGEVQRLPALAADMTRLGVDVIVSGNSLSTVAAMKATSTIPIVMTSSAVRSVPDLSPVWLDRAATSPGSAWIAVTRARCRASGLGC